MDDARRCFKCYETTKADIILEKYLIHVQISMKNRLETLF